LGRIGWGGGGGLHPYATEGTPGTTKKRRGGPGRGKKDLDNHHRKGKYGQKTHTGPKKKELQGCPKNLTVKVNGKKPPHQHLLKRPAGA